MKPSAYPGVSWEFNQFTYPSFEALGRIHAVEATPFKTLANALALDRFHDLEAHTGIDDALELLKNARQTDMVYQAIVKGVPMPLETIAKAIQMDRTVDVRIAHLIQNILNYRRRNSEGNHLLEHLLNGQVYQGADTNSFSASIRNACLDVVKRELEQLRVLSGQWY
jgi:hypothetical protein